MPEIKAPFPKRFPKLVTPKSAAPWDVVAAITAIEHDAYQALIKEPAAAAGITAPPELPGPGTLASMLVAPLQGFLGGPAKVSGGITEGITPSPSPNIETPKVEPVKEEIVS